MARQDRLTIAVSRVPASTARPMRSSSSGSGCSLDRSRSCRGRSLTRVVRFLWAGTADYSTVAVDFLSALQKRLILLISVSL